ALEQASDPELRSSLNSQEKEQRLARGLAEAELAKKQAAQLLANHEGIFHKSPSFPTPTATPTGGKPFGFSFDSQLFENFGGLECEETERTELNKAHQQLIETQKYFNGAAEKFTAFIKKATEMR
ncbi:unnamed protein product, partial [Prorocentrum cordatum]